MAEVDLAKFIRKVESLNRLISSLDDLPERRDELAACESHDEVVTLAKSWGFDIGRRWGDD